MPAIPNPPGTDAQTLERPEILPTLFGSGYNDYQVKPLTFVFSFLLHSVALALVVWSGYWVVEHKNQIKRQVVSIVTNEPSPYLASLPRSKAPVGGGGGGGDHDKLPAPHGGLPKASMEQVTPPMVVRRNDHPKLEMDPSVIVPPNIPLPHDPNLGDPMSKISGVLSNGTGSGGGIGRGVGTGVGPGRGPGVGPGNGGGIGGGNFKWGGGLQPPKVLYQPDPEYSEEARKARYQGTVVLWVMIGADGRPSEMRVQRSLGMGLDERALAAVRTWKFEPARSNGQALAVPILIEVNFHLY